jgi:predicted Zn-dependent peptidase
MPNRTIAPKITEAVEFDLVLPPRTKYILRNGVELHVVDLGTQETLMINWVFFAGNWFEQKNLVAATTNYLLKNGTSKRNAYELNEHFDFYGAHLSRSCQHETAEITLHCLSKHASELLPVVAEMITDSVFPADELDIYKKNMQQRLRVSLLKNDFVAGRLIDAYLFGEQHPYGKYSSLVDYDQLQQEEIRAFYQTYYQQGRCIIFAAGRIPDKLVAELEGHFGQLPLVPPKDKTGQITHPVSPASEKKYRLVNDPNGVQAAIRIGRHFPNRHHPDFQKVQVLNNLFGGFFGSRLMTNIREDKGYTYGIYSYLMNQLQQSAWIVSTEAGTEVCQSTIDEVYKEMLALREEPVEQEELRATKNYLIGTILGDLDGPFHVAGRWKNLVLNDLDENYFYSGIQIIKSIQPDELQQLAIKYLDPQSFYELVVI